MTTLMDTATEEPTEELSVEAKVDALLNTVAGIVAHLTPVEANDDAPRTRNNGYPERVVNPAIPSQGFAMANNNAGPPTTVPKGKVKGKDGKGFVLNTEPGTATYRQMRALAGLTAANRDGVRVKFLGDEAKEYFGTFFSASEASTAIQSLQDNHAIELSNGLMLWPSNNRKQR